MKMKRLITLAVTALALPFALASCEKEEKMHSIVGSWALQDVNFDAKAGDPSMSALLNTFLNTYMKEEMEIFGFIRFTEEGKVIEIDEDGDEETMGVYSLNGNKLRIMGEDGIVTMTLSMPDPNTLKMRMDMLATMETSDPEEAAEFLEAMEEFGGIRKLDCILTMTKVG